MKQLPPKITFEYRGAYHGLHICICSTSAFRSIENTNPYAIHILLLLHNNYCNSNAEHIITTVNKKRNIN